MADATISGFLDSGYTINKSTTAANVSTSRTTLAPSASGQNQITFSASVNNIAAGTASAGAVAGTGWTTNFATGGANVAQEVTAANSKAGITALAITYDLGMAKLHYGLFTSKSGGDTDQKAKANIMGVSMPFGATTVGITSSTAQRTNAAATKVKATGYRAKVSYALSKRKSAYGAYGAYGTEKVDASTANDKQTAIGLIHAF